MDDIAVFFATSTLLTLVCDWTSRSTHPSLDHNHGLLAVAKFSPGSYQSLQQNDDTKLDHAVYHPNDEQPDYFLEGIVYFAMPAEVEPSEVDRRALAAANLERKMGKRKNLSARKDVQDLIKEMDPAS